MAMLVRRKVKMQVQMAALGERVRVKIGPGGIVGAVAGAQL